MSQFTVETRYDIDISFQLPGIDLSETDTILLRSLVPSNVISPICALSR